MRECVQSRRLTHPCVPDDAQRVQSLALTDFENVPIGHLMQADLVPLVVFLLVTYEPAGQRVPMACCCCCCIRSSALIL
jgi:hypothetical protein